MQLIKHLIKLLNMPFIHHIAVWTHQLEKLRSFYTTFFNGKSNHKYVNPAKGFESYFITFEDGCKLEIMQRTDIQNVRNPENHIGLTHLAFSFPTKEEVLKQTKLLCEHGYSIVGEPRTSGDGYFESVVLDPDGNRIECVYQPTSSC